MTLQNEDKETDKIAIIAAACASAIWIYDQIKLPNGINVAMLLCIIFIISSFLYIMMTGLTLSTNKTASIRILLIKKTKCALFSFTIKYFWYVFIYLLYILAMSYFDIGFQEANGILTVLTIIFGVALIASLFRKPQGKIDQLLEKIYSKFNNK